MHLPLLPVYLRQSRRQLYLLFDAKGHLKDSNYEIFRGNFEDAQTLETLFAQPAPRYFHSLLTKKLASGASLEVQATFALPFYTAAHEWEIQLYEPADASCAYWLWSTPFSEKQLHTFPPEECPAIEFSAYCIESAYLQSTFLKETILESTSESIWALDHEFRLLYANRAYMERFKEITGMTFRVGEQVIDTQSQEPGQVHYRQLYERALAGETVRTLEHFPHVSGISYIDHQLRPIIQAGKVIGVAGFAADFTQLKYYERELEQLNQTFIYVNTPVLLLNAKMDGFLRVNPNARKTFQIQEGSCFQQFLLQFSDVDPLLTMRKRLCSGELSSGRVTLQTIDKKHFLDVSIQKLHHEGEIWFVWFIRDITDSTRQLDQLKRQNDLLHELAWFHAHRLREPLTKILALLDVLDAMPFSLKLEDISIVQTIRENAQFIDEHLQESVHLLRAEEVIGATH
ncbi:MAG: PAS domain-containing protein [Nitritalea sp.]